MTRAGLRFDDRRRAVIKIQNFFGASRRRALRFHRRRLALGEFAIFLGTSRAPAPTLFITAARFLVNLQYLNGLSRAPSPPTHQLIASVSAASPFKERCRAATERSVYICVADTEILPQGKTSLSEGQHHFAKHNIICRKATFI